MVRILLIGGTGHIGGAVLEKLLEQQPDTDIQVLVRDAGKAARLTVRYPKVQTVVGDTTSSDVLKTASRQADIVIYASPDITHEKGILTILDAMKTHEGPKPYYIHTSGAALIWDEPTGSKDARLWDDIEDAKDIAALKAEGLTHAITDKIVRDAAPDVNVAIISPTFVGGLSPSWDHPTPITTDAFLLAARNFKTGFQIAQGENVHTWVHVLDLARVYTLLATNAVDFLSGKPQDSTTLPVWGPEAYYFVASEYFSFAEFMAHVTPVLKEHGIIDNTKVRSVSVKEAVNASLVEGGWDPDGPSPTLDSWAIQIAIMYGINMRVRASRLQKLGWKPEEGSIVDSLSDVFAEHLRREKETKRTKI